MHLENTECGSRVVNLWGWFKALSDVNAVHVTDFHESSTKIYSSDSLQYLSSQVGQHSSMTPVICVTLGTCTSVLLD